MTTVKFYPPQLSAAALEGLQYMLASYHATCAPLAMALQVALKAERYRRSAAACGVLREVEAIRTPLDVFTATELKGARKLARRIAREFADTASAMRMAAAIAAAVETERARRHEKEHAG